MDRINSSLLGSLGLQQARPVGPRQVDPSARLRLVDRQDTVELTRVPGADSTKSSKPEAVRSGLVAGTVDAPRAVDPSLAAAASAAMKLYSNPSDQNAAATRAAAAQAGSTLDVTA